MEASTLPDLVDVETERGRRSLKYFLERAWHIVEPARDFIDNWHVDAVVEHLEAITNGQITDLVINIPPGMMKSLTVSVFWPVWEWISYPATRWLFSSYAQDLSTRDAVKSRRIIQSPWFRERWGDCFQLTGDQNVKTRYENDQTGFRLATSVGGIGTGERGDRIVADDPHNVKEGESEVKRQGVVLWWSEVMSTRKNDPQRSARVVIMQRVHEEDVTAWCLVHGFEHLCLPMEYEGENRTVTSLGWQDPRHTEGELLFAKLFPRQSVEKMKSELLEYGTASQFQQRPTPRYGSFFSSLWFKDNIVDACPIPMQRVRYWDKAGTAGAGHYTAGVLMGWDPRSRAFFIEDIVRGQWEAPDREAIIKATAQADKEKHGLVTTWIEQEPGSGGKESAQATVRNLIGHTAYAEPVTGDKFARATPLAAQAKVGNVKVQRAAWNEAFFRELDAAGPGAKYLDQMDAAAGAFNKLAKKTATSMAGVKPVSMEQENVFADPYR